MSEPLLTQTELATAAFHLLASSSVSRYSRMAARAAHESALRQVLHDDPAKLEVLLRRAKSLWREVVESACRDAAEVELAVLVSLLAETAASDVRDMMLDFAIDQHATTAWITALCRQLLHRGASNTDLPCGEVGSGGYVAASPLDRASSVVHDDEVRPWREGRSQAATCLASA